MRLRTPAMPLITVDPFFSIWSCGDTLYSAEAQHWSGKRAPLMIGAFADGEFRSIGAFDCTGKAFAQRKVYQTDAHYTATSTFYTFEDDDIRVMLRFTSPLLLNRLDILARPVSYVEYDILNKTGKDVSFLFGISSLITVDRRSQCVEFKKTPYSLSCGNACQNVLAQSGDTVKIDWGYLHLCDTDAYVAHFDEDGALVRLPMNDRYNAHLDNPCLAVMKYDSHGVITLAYDEVKPIEYLGTILDEYYTKFFSGFGDMVCAAKSEYEEIKALCDKFDAELSNEASRLSEHYERICSLAYRQSIAAHKLVEDKCGNLLFMSKENDSNGCIATLDVSYPTAPLFLKYNPELVLAMLRPIVEFAESDKWEFAFPPHDVGQYPIANGAVYGIKNGKQMLEMQMPVEEAGNMLILLAAYEKFSGGDKLFFNEHKDTMAKWVKHLVDMGYDPDTQLCTDDFAGHLAHNCNLSLKAIMGIASYGRLSGDKTYTELARDLARRWEADAKASHGATRLAFDKDGTWSLKYNAVWDSLLDFNILSEEFKASEGAHYLKKLNRYGTPLDSRAEYSKPEWMLWTAAMSGNKEYFDKICESITNMLNETRERVPFADWYYTTTASQVLFKNRPVVGGLFINLL